MPFFSWILENLQAICAPSFLFELCQYIISPTFVSTTGSGTQPLFYKCTLHIFPPFYKTAEGLQGKIPLTSGILPVYASMMPCLPIFYLTLLTAEKESALCRENTDKPEVQNRHSHLPFQPVVVLLISVLTNLPYSVALGSPELENPIMGFPALENPLVCFGKMRTPTLWGE